MRVIAGIYRGKKLKEFSLSSTKPTLDRVKESLFSSIQFDLIDACVLDLFAGTGALGIESVSRGAKSVDFVDSNTEAIKIIKENLQGIKGDYTVTKSDYMSYLVDAKRQAKQYDIILLDPPYDSDFGVRAIEYILTNNLLSDNGIIIYEKLYNTPFELNIEGYTFTQKKYGTVGVVKISKSE
ncbi:MAG: 16S rRNA (guanine(966)-N(2))-methyltransferase RsmD [Clostridia bacterium]|nr:16S rRNA (guanine(966)-N(2))-methyltransferase RsmD [Clostridia bacterium]